MMPITDDPSTVTSQPGRPQQATFNKEETDFLKTYLSTYGALCDHLAKQATGPRGTGSVKGSKKDWILSKVFPEFIKQFLSDQNSGPQLQSLQTVSYLLSHIIVAEVLVETIAMVLESLTSSKFWLRFNGINYRLSHSRF